MESIEIYRSVNIYLQCDLTTVCIKYIYHDIPDDSYSPLETLDTYNMLNQYLISDLTTLSMGYMKRNSEETVYDTQYLQLDIHDVTTTSSQTFVQRQCLISPLLPEGNYQIGYYVTHHSDEIRVTINNTTIRHVITERGSSFRHCCSGRYYYKGGGTLHIAIDYKSNVLNAISIIYQGDLTIWRLT
jgi:hypothetical protein